MTWFILCVIVCCIVTRGVVMSKVFSVRLDDKLVKWLDRIAKDEHRKRNNVIEKLLMAAKKDENG